MQEIVADIGDWVEFEYTPIYGNQPERYRGYVIDAFLTLGVYRVYVPKSQGTYRVPFEKTKPLPIEIDAEGASAIADFALDTNDREWFENLMKGTPQEVTDGDQ